MLWIITGCLCYGSLIGMFIVIVSCVLFEERKDRKNGRR